MKLSVVIPAKNEPYLQQTVDDIESKKQADTEVLWMEDSGLGQRGTTNALVEKAQGEYIMKVDAHCMFDEGFDVKMLEDIDENTILAPRLLALDAENWQPRLDCPPSSQYVFDTNLVMQYDRSRENLDPIVETMCLQGSAFMVRKDKYWEWNLGDTTMPSWGGQGTELGIKAFLNGGVCKTTNKTWYAHLFRQTDADFPYDRGDNPGQQANEELIKRYKNKSIAPLIERFNYPIDWSKEEVDKLAVV